jgi:hypothetical protein
MLTPTPTGIEAMVCEDIAKRQALGIAKYGTTVADNPLPLRQWLRHAYEEALDQAIYLRRAIDEIDRQQDDEVRITKGVARYTETFTPPTAQFPDDGK